MHIRLHIRIALIVLGLFDGFPGIDPHLFAQPPVTEVHSKAELRAAYDTLAGRMRQAIFDRSCETIRYWRDAEIVWVKGDRRRSIPMFDLGERTLFSFICGDHRALLADVALERCFYFDQIPHYAWPRPVELMTSAAWESRSFNAPYRDPTLVRGLREFWPLQSERVMAQLRASTDLDPVDRHMLILYWKASMDHVRPWDQALPFPYDTINAEANALLAEAPAYLHARFVRAYIRQEHERPRYFLGVGLSFGQPIAMGGVQDIVGDLGLTALSIDCKWRHVHLRLSGSTISGLTRTDISALDQAWPNASRLSGSYSILAAGYRGNELRRLRITPMAGIGMGRLSLVPAGASDEEDAVNRSNAFLQGLLETDIEYKFNRCHRKPLKNNIEDPGREQDVRDWCAVLRIGIVGDTFGPALDTRGATLFIAAGVSYYMGNRYLKTN